MNPEDNQSTNHIITEAFSPKERFLLDSVTTYIRTGDPKKRTAMLPQLTTSFSEVVNLHVPENNKTYLKKMLVESACEIFSSESDKHKGVETDVVERGRQIVEAYNLLKDGVPQLNIFEKEEIEVIIAEAIKTARERDWKKVVGTIKIIHRDTGDEAEVPILSMVQPSLTPEQRAKMSVVESVARVNQMAKEVQDLVIGSEEAIKIAQVALLANAHLLMVGLPGEAKSMFANELFRRLQGTKFAKQLKPGTNIEEILGLPNFAQLKKSIWQLVPRGLPQANYAFLDELFRAQPMLLSALLDILNERMLKEGLTSIETPLMWAIATSNFVVIDEAMDAFLDRFPFRVAVGDVTNPLRMYEVARAHEAMKAGRLRKFDDNIAEVKLEDVLYLREVVNSRNSHEIYLPPHVLYLANMVGSNILSTDQKGIALRRISSRTRALIPDVLRINALLDSRSVVNIGDLNEALGYCLVPAVMGDIGREKDFFTGVAERRVELADQLGKVLREFSQEGIYPALDTILHLSDVVDSMGKIPADARIFFKLPAATTELSLENIVTFMNTVSDVANTNHRVAELFRNVTKKIHGAASALNYGS